MAVEGSGSNQLFEEAPQYFGREGMPRIGGGAAVERLCRISRIGRVSRREIARGNQDLSFILFLAPPGLEGIPVRQCEDRSQEKGLGDGIAAGKAFGGKITAIQERRDELVTKSCATQRSSM